MAELLLHSLAEFRELILSLLDVTDARTVVEVGGEDGTFTAELAAWAEPRGGKVWCIDPEPAPGLVALGEEASAVSLVRERSLDALEHLEPADAYLLDGDHNHYTVLHELEAVEARAAGDGWVVVLHDVGWPSGRRDMYYAPETVPPGARHPHRYDRGVVPGTPEAVTGGFRGAGQFAWAEHEGGPRNGVLTAVEDFLAGRDHLRLAVVPCVFGLGVLYPAAAPWAERLSALLAPYDRNPLLERLEDNRLALYLKVLDLQDDLSHLHGDLDDARLRIRDVEVENRALWARVGELEARVASVESSRQVVRQELASLSRSRALAVAEGVSRLWWRSGDGAGVSRQRLRRLLDDTEV